MSTEDPNLLLLICAGLHRSEGFGQPNQVNATRNWSGYQGFQDNSTIQELAHSDYGMPVWWWIQFGSWPQLHPPAGKEVFPVWGNLSLGMLHSGSGAAYMMPSCQTKYNWMARHLHQPLDTGQLLTMWGVKILVGDVRQPVDIPVCKWQCNTFHSRLDLLNKADRRLAGVKQHMPSFTMW